MQYTPDLVLEKNNVRLSLLSEQDQVALERIAQDEKIWKYNPSFNDPGDFLEKWFVKALQQKAQNTRIPLVIHNKNEIIGSSSFYDFDPIKNTICIGYTWLKPDYWGSGINTIVKKLMIQYACENGITEIYFVIDILNKRSQNAVIKLGAKEKEIYRDHMKRPDCTMRDSIIYALNCQHFPLNAD